jgi:hypothetical protein
VAVFDFGNVIENHRSVSVEFSGFGRKSDRQPRLMFNLGAELETRRFRASSGEGAANCGEEFGHIQRLR